MKRSLLVLALLLVAGCYLEERRMRNVPEEGSSSWRFGYADGCQSGKSDAGSVRKQQKDVVRFRADDDYRSGWQQGYRECYDRETQDLLAPPVPEPAAATPAPLAATAPTAPRTPPSAAARRAEIEARLDALRKEMRSLETELEALPKGP